MKSRTFCFNGKLFLNTLGRYSFLGVIMSIVYFFFITLPSGSLMASVVGRLFIEDFSPVFYNFIAVILGIISGLVLFSYLHQPRQVNFYHAQTVNRSTLLTHRLLLGIIYHTASILVNLILIYCLGIAFNSARFLPWLKILTTVGQTTLVFLCVFSLTALSAQWTGTRFAHAEVTLFLLFFPLALVWGVDSLIETFQESYHSGPISQFLQDLTPLNHFYHLTLPGALYLILLTIVLVWLCYFLYHRRPLERAGSTVIYPSVGHFVRISGSFVCALLNGLLNWSIYAVDSAYTAALHTLGGMILMILLWNMICQVQIHHSFKASLRGLRSQTIVLAATVLVFALASPFGSAYGNIAYQPEQLASIEFDLGYQPWAGEYFIDTDGLTSRRIRLRLQEESSKKTAAELVSVLQAEQKRLAEGQPAHDPDSIKLNTAEYAESPYYTNLVYTFYPKFGIPTSHDFYETLSVDDVAALNALYALPEFRSLHIIHDFSADTASQYVWSLCREWQTVGVTIPESRIPALVESLQQDIMDCQIDIRENPVATLSLYIATDKYGSKTAYASIPIYRSFPRTMLLMDDMRLIITDK